MKKIISLVLVAVITLSLLTGCIFNRINSEEDLINIQIGGYLYTSQLRADSKEEQIFLKTRKKLIDEMIEQAEKTAKYAFKTTDGTDEYEENLLKYVDKIESPDDYDKSVIFTIADGITPYKVLLDSYEEELRQYMKMKPGDDASEAIINTYLADSVFNLINLQNEYLGWLKNNTASIVYILNKSNPRQADRLTSSAASIFEKKISADFLDAINELESFSMLNSALLSADYYSSFLYFEKAKISIDLIKSGKSEAEVSPADLSKLETLYTEALGSIKKPNSLKPIPDKKESFSIFRKISAADSEPDYGYQSIVMMMEYYLNYPVIEMYLSTLPEISEEAIIQNISENQKNISNNPSLMNTFTEKAPEPSIKLSVDADLSNEKAKEEAEKRENIIKNIGRAQSLISGISFLNESAAYNTAISQIASLIANGNNKLSEADTNQIIETIKANLGELIGDNRTDFINLIVTESAENIYSTFEIWRDNIKNIKEHVFTQDDLRDLLTIMGVTLTEITDNPEPSASFVPPSGTVPVPTQTTVPQNTESPVEPNIPSDSTETTDNFDIAHITGFWQTIRELDITLDNSSILYTIYGWTDLLDYSMYKKEESKDDNGNLKVLRYLDANNKPVGWETRVYSESIEYTYRFPDDNEHSIWIIRYGSFDSSNIYEVRTEDKTTERKTAVRFRQPGDTNGTESIIYISQTQSNKRDGLNTSRYNSNPSYTIFDMEEILESYTFKDGILIREFLNTHSGSDIVSKIKIYYDNGKIKHDYSELNGDEDGLYLAYYENGRVSMAVNYKQGQYHGTVETFYEDGHTNDFTTYSDGKKDGISYGYYSDEPHYLQFESEYSNGLENGIFKRYSVKGSLNLEIEYKEGTPNGIYRDYLIDDEIHTDAYHVFGQNENGKRVGIWEFGRNNIDWIERVYYEDGVKIWSEYADSKYRTYYNSDGSVNRTETKP